MIYLWSKQALKAQCKYEVPSKWLVRFNTGGYSLLSQDSGGRKTNTMGRPRKREPQTELEKLQYRIHYMKN